MFSKRSPLGSRVTPRRAKSPGFKSNVIACRHLHSSASHKTVVYKTVVDRKKHDRVPSRPPVWSPRACLYATLLLSDATFSTLPVLCFTLAHLHGDSARQREEKHPAIRKSDKIIVKVLNVNKIIGISRYTRFFQNFVIQNLLLVWRPPLFARRRTWEVLVQLFSTGHGSGHSIKMEPLVDSAVFVSPHRCSVIRSTCSLRVLLLVDNW